MTGRLTELERDRAQEARAGVRAIRDTIMCDECGLPNRPRGGRPGTLLWWPHPSRVPARATRDELSYGVPFYFPPVPGAPWGNA